MAWQAMSWKVILLLSMIIPLAVFTGLRLAGNIGPAPVETFALKPVTWQFNQTPGDVHVDQFLNATYVDDAGKMFFSVYLGAYSLSDDGTPSSLQVLPSFSATPLSQDFSVVSVVFSFGQGSQSSLIDLQDSTISHENLSLSDYSSGQSAYAQFVGNGSSVGVECQFLVWWYLLTGTNVTSNREVTCDVIYFNGTAYKEAIQPFDLTLLGGAYARIDIGSRVADYSTSDAVSGVNVWVDGRLYSTPISGLIVLQGVHNLTVPPTINLNGTLYRFSSWSSGEFFNSIALDITSDLSRTANYEPALLGS